MDSTKVFILFLMRIYTDFLFMGLNKDGDPKVPIYLSDIRHNPLQPDYQTIVSESSSVGSVNNFSSAFSSLIYF
jgi:hypothetical protein